MSDIEVELELALLYDYRKRIMDDIQVIYSSTASTSIEIPDHLLRNLVEINKSIEKAPAAIAMKKIMRMK